MLRDLLEGTGPTWKREHPVAARWADFVIFDGDRPVHVIEVKKVVRQAPEGNWTDSPDFTQLRWYADQLDTPGTLIDSHRLILVQRHGTEPWREISRRSCTAADFEVIRHHLVSG